MDTLTFIASVLGTLVWPGIVGAIIWTFHRPISGLIESVSDFEGFGAKIRVGKPYAKASEAAESAVGEIDESTRAKVDAIKNRAEGNATGGVDGEDQSLREPSGQAEMPPANHVHGEVAAPPIEREPSSKQEDIVTSLADEFKASDPRPPETREPTLDSHVAGEGNPWQVTLDRHGPTAAVLSAWQGVETAVRGLAATSGVKTSKSMTASIVFHARALQASQITGPAFTDAVLELQAIRNKVVHGQSIPNFAEGLTFITSAWELTRACEGLARFRKAYSPRGSGLASSHHGGITVTDQLEQL